MRADREGLWKVLRMHGVDGKLLKSIKNMHEDTKSAVQVGGDLTEFFNLTVGIKQECIMSLWLFNVHMDEVMREIQNTALDVGIPMMREGRVWKKLVLLFANDTVLLSVDKWELQRLQNKFGNVCKKQPEN